MGAILIFEPIGADIYIGHHPGLGTGLLKGEAKLAFTVRLSQGESISISPDERTLERWGGAVLIVAESDDVNRIESKVSGLITYFPAQERSFEFPSQPASYLVEAVVSKNQFDELLSAARLDRLPRVISISVKDMEFNSLPDGSGKKWDVRAHRNCEVASIEFRVPLIAPVKGTDDDSKELDNLFPPTRSQVKELSEKLDGMALTVLATKDVLRSLLWAVLLIGAIIVFFRFF